MSHSKKVVALGGGHGLAATLRALRGITSDITAVVTVADNGGSSGRLRAEFSILPPGDLRMALAALCSDDEWGRSWADVMQYRFTSEGPLNGHAVGNLLLAALWDRDSDIIASLDQVAALLKVEGRVLPMAMKPMDIVATLSHNGEVRVVSGQVEVATTAGQLIDVQLLPQETGIVHQDVLSAIAEAEWITMGPGSWITSVLPHLLLPELRDALIASPAKKIAVMNLDTHSDGSHFELSGHSILDHLDLLQRFAPGLHFDMVIIDSHAEKTPELITYLTERKTALFEADLRDEMVKIHHDSEKLASAFTHMERESLV